MVTGIYTGADQSDLPLTMQGMLGQDHVSDKNKVWITKTFHPLYTGDTQSFKANKMVCVVRNPLDVFVSDAHESNTTSHCLMPAENYATEFPEWWKEFVNQSAVRMQFYQKVVNEDISKKIPTYIVRYEDLIISPEKTLSELFCFLFGISSAEY